MIPSILLLLACTDIDNGTVVGNPGDAAARVAPVSAELTLDEAEAYVTAVELFSCEGEVEELDLSQFLEEEDGDEEEELEIDLLEDDFELPGGTWCALGIELETLSIEGSGPDDSAFAVELEPGWIEVEARGGFVVDGQSFVFEVAEPQWLSSELLGLTAGELTELGPGDALHDALADTVALRSALFEDGDGDGQVGTDERETGAIAGGEAREQDVVDTGSDGFQETTSVATTTGGCGRSRVSGAAGVLLLPLLLLGWRRR